MALKEGRDFVLVPKIQVNEGMTTGEITTAWLLALPGKFYVIPTESIQSLGMSTQLQRWANNGDDPLAVLQAMLANDGTFPNEVEEFIDSLANEAMDQDPNRRQRVFPVDQAEKFSVSVGWKFLNSGMRIKLPGDNLKIFNIPSQEKRAALKGLYEQKLK